MVVTLDIPTWPVGTYNITVSKPDVDPYAISNAFVVNTGQANLETNLVVPGTMGRSWRQTIWIEYANTGDSSMLSPLLKLDGSSDDAMLTLDPSQPGLRTDTPPTGASNIMGSAANICRSSRSAPISAYGEFVQ